MIQCPKCSAGNPPESRFCNSCGEELSSISQAPTVAAPEGAVPISPVNVPHVGRIVSSDSVPAGGFTPGTILADRYRIIGLLGRGGMGEVYRADDLKLGQPVALKFLPPALAEDSVRRERFFAEVRITRQLSHPNICRVYDIGEVDGRHFLSMEYIDGEDLASLMKRIGRLSNEKALDIARQLVAGLSVAHERGVLHRDLKPANIMLDGHGRVRITDFGLAIAVGDESQAEEIAGTPAYMAPEQLAGKGATVRSDIYSLGLILYEIYTGKKAFKATTLAELRNQKETQTPRAPSELRDGIDPVVERVIQRCMEKDPNSRPASVAQLAQALPGGDPLAAAIAAGETPSPEMVAASGGKEGLRPAVAWGILAFIIAGTIAVAAMNDRVTLYRRAPFEKHPQFLVERAQEIVGKAGYKAKFEDSAYGFMINSDLMHYIEKNDETANRWKDLDAQTILFWYRQSPRPLEAPVLSIRGLGVVTDSYPPLQFSNEILVVLNAEGHLVSLRAVPPQKQSSTGSAPAPDWNVLFAETGLDSLPWTPDDPQWSPPFYADTREAWKGELPIRPGVDMWIEAAAFQGKPVSFDVIGPWTRATQMEPSEPRWMVREGIVFAVLFSAALIAGGLFFARRNLRLGRGDRRNATRLAVFVGCSVMLCLIFQAHHVLTLWELVLLSIFACLSLAMGGLLWILYIAIEPFIRRRWPRIIVSWTRIVSGDWRDPGVARDILIGCLYGLLSISLYYIGFYFIPSWLGYAEVDWPPDIFFGSILQPRFFISDLLATLWGGVVTGLGFVSILFFLQVLLRNQKAAFAAFILFLSWSVNPWAIPTYLVVATLLLFTMMRFGLLALVAGSFINILCLRLPITLDASAWHKNYGFATLAVLAAIVLYAFYYSLGGRPMFGTPRLDD